MSLEKKEHLSKLISAAVAESYPDLASEQKQYIDVAWVLCAVALRTVAGAPTPISAIAGLHDSFTHGLRIILANHAQANTVPRDEAGTLDVIVRLATAVRDLQAAGCTNMGIASALQQSALTLLRHEFHTAQPQILYAAWVDLSQRVGRQLILGEKPTPQ